MKRKTIVILSVLIIVVTMFSLCFRQSFAYVTQYKLAGSVNSTSYKYYNLYSNYNINYNYNFYTNLTSASIMSDAKGMASKNIVYFNMYTTTGNFMTKINVQYDLANSSAHSNTQLPDGEYENVISPHFIRFAVFESTSAKAVGNLLSGPFSLDEMPLVSTDSSNIYSAKFSLFQNFLNKSTRKYIAIKMWISEEINEYDCYNMVNLKLKFDTIGMPADPADVVTLNTDIYMTDTHQYLTEGIVVNPLTGEKIELEGGASFTMSNLYEGTLYTLYADVNNTKAIVPFIIAHDNEIQGENSTITSVSMGNTSVNNTNNLYGFPWSIAFKGIYQGRNVITNETCSQGYYVTLPSMQRSVVYVHKDQTVDIGINLYNETIGGEKFYYGLLE